ncbi:MAG: sugar phosphate nucleotidyltransferase, partial [Dehalococcoidia bacterium]|nr:sugar phosphate nucleotidyltransferase [Dehalococcoidia bacterium]
QVRPKPALPFAGRFRVIDFSLSNCIHSQIGDIAVLIDYQRSHLENYLRRWHSVNAVTETFDILEPRKGSYCGTADAIYQNLAYLQKQTTDRILILAGDHVYKMDYRKMLAFHEQVKADVTVGVAPVPIEQAHRFGILTTDANGRILEFVEKPELPQSNLASMGIYIFNKDILAERLIEDAEQPDSPHDFGYAVIPGMVKRDRVYAYKFDGYWRDIGTTEAYYAANMELTSPKSSFSLNGAWPIFTEGNTLSVTRILDQGSIKNSLVSPGWVIKGRVENSIISPGVWVDEQAVVRNSVLMDNVFVGYHSVVDRCILDEGVNIGELCYIGFGSSPASGDGNITVLGRGVNVPAHTAVGRQCKVSPHVECDDFISMTVISGSAVSPLSRDNMTVSEERTLVR